MLKYPVDAEGYAQLSVDLCSDLRVYNLGVIDLLDAQEQALSIAALWSEMGPHVTADPSTWETENWPDPRHVFLSNRYATSEQAFRNRVHPRLIHAFSQLYGTSELWTTIDFWGVKRATVFGDYTRPDWRVHPLVLHWDTDITKYVKDRAQGRQRYQALVALNDNDQQVGSFECVPGSANELETWLRSYQPKDGKYVPRNNPLQQQTQRIPLRAGHCVIWDVGTAHANFSNYSCYPRLTQYVRMVPRTFWAELEERQTITHYWKTHPDLKQKLKSQNWSLTEAKILGLIP